jgi:NAD(P)H-dependent FMN reductase
MAKLLATAGSNSSTSINLKLVRHTLGSFAGHEVDLVDGSQLDIPLYSEDREKKQGFPDAIRDLHAKLRNCDGLILSVNEHNSNPSAYTKNLLDWLSRLERKFMAGVPVLLMSASGGKRGAQSSREITARMLERFGAEQIAQFSLPGFHEVFRVSEGILDPALKLAHQQAVEAFREWVE